jgi:hypothetical protein
MVHIGHEKRNGSERHNPPPKGIETIPERIIIEGNSLKLPDQKQGEGRSDKST